MCCVVPYTPYWVVLFFFVWLQHCKLNHLKKMTIVEKHEITITQKKGHHSITVHACITKLAICDQLTE